MKEKEKQFIANEDGKTYQPPFNMDIVMEKSKSYQETMDKWREILIVRGFNEETIYTLTNEEIENIVDKKDLDRYRIEE